MSSLRPFCGREDDMKLKFTRKTWYFRCWLPQRPPCSTARPSRAAPSFSLIEQIAFAAAGIAALPRGGKGSASWEKRNFTGVFVLLMW